MTRTLPDGTTITHTAAGRLWSRPDGDLLSTNYGPWEPVETPTEFVDALIAATREMVRVLKPSGSIFVNLGDKYSDKSLMLLPERYRIRAVDELDLIAQGQTPVAIERALRRAGRADLWLRIRPRRAGADPWKEAA